jgi:hypothetical protein
MSDTYLSTSTGSESAVGRAVAVVTAPAPYKSRAPKSLTDCCRIVIPILPNMILIYT